jgi:hypothetical protein
MSYSFEKLIGGIMQQDLQRLLHVLREQGVDIRAKKVFKIDPAARKHYLIQNELLASAEGTDHGE